MDDNRNLFPHEVCKKTFNVPCFCFQCQVETLANWMKSTPLERRSMFKVIIGGKNVEEKGTG